MKKHIQEMLMKYSLTAAAIAVAGINANAQVQYSGLINENVTSSYDLNLNNDQVNDFTFLFGKSSFYPYFQEFAAIKAINSDEWLLSNTNNFYFIKAMSTNSIISESKFWGNHYFHSNLGQSNGYGNSANHFMGHGEKYIGVRLNMTGVHYYGWIRVVVSSSNITVKDWAYEQTANKAIKAGQTTALNEVSSDDLNITFGPNPTTGYLKISADDNYNIEIVDLSGKIVLSAQMQNNKAEFDMSDLQSGIYIANLTNDNKTTSLNIVKE